MDEIVEDTDPIRSSQDSIEVEIVSDEEFQMLDEAIQNAMMAHEGKTSLAMPFNPLQITLSVDFIDIISLISLVCALHLSIAAFSFLGLIYFLKDGQRGIGIIKQILLSSTDLLAVYNEYNFFLDN